MHLHFERNVSAKCDCTILSLSWMGKVPDELPEEEGWKLNRNNYYQEGWLATGNVRGVVGVTFTSSRARPQDMPLRTNYNLRGHRSDVILVKWNEPYQKLASCDSSGVIFVWIKYEGRWSIELINDRSTPVTHFSWSHDGRMALICYQDGFVLVGSVAGQRYWSSMLSLDARITCGCWTPNDSQVYLGTASAQLVVMDVHGAMVSQVQLVAEGGITSMAWSCEKFNMEEGEDLGDVIGSGHVLAVALGNGEIVLLRGHDDVSPIRISTGMRGDTVAIEWANSKELLAVAGTLLPESQDVMDAPPYNNVVKFYSDTGALIYTISVPYKQSCVSALTWGHATRRIFVSCGGVVCVARVWRCVAPLQLLARVCTAQALAHPTATSQLPLPPRLHPLVTSLFAHTIRCNVPECHELRSFVSRPPAAPGRLHCTMLRHDDDETGAYTLYLEHMGGLVPLLKGRRTSKIRPEFVIFDPQAEVNVSVSSSSTSSSSTTSSNTSSAGVSPRTPPPPSVTRSHLTHTDSEDTDREDGCSGSPRLPRRRRARERRKIRNMSDREDGNEELAYVDSLPEGVRLVQVTSNIWGTKFKMHGLAKNVPANLGQVTYKTSLLHLQPRQMTLMITELKDDLPVGPDPNFNPNIFSEDEEEGFQSNETESPSHNNNLRRKLTLNEKTNNANNINHNESYTGNNNMGNNPSLARAESYEELPYIDMNEVNSVPETVYSTPVRHTAQTSERRVNNAGSVSNRHAISPLRCEGSVPTLQSPKNAVAPTDIIFERPSPQTVSCGGRGDFCGGRTDYSVRDNVSIKTNISEQPFNLNLTIEPSRQVTIKKIDTHVTDNCLSKLRKNICNRGEASFDINTRILKSFCNKNYEHEVHPDAMTKKIDTFKNLQRNDELKFIDEETPVETNINNITERIKDTRVQRTTTIVPISPVCGNVPVYDTMTRSCSVGYLDLVDPQVLHAQVSLSALRGEPQRRLVLVNNKRHRRQRKYKTHDSKHIDISKTPNLKQCGKSKSLDSSELSLHEGKRRQSKQESLVPIKIDNISAKSSSRCNSTGEETSVTSNEDKDTRRSRKDYPVCTVCRLVSPYDRRDVDDTNYVCVACSARSQQIAASASQPDTDSDYSKYYSSLEQLALRLLASRGRRANRNSSSTTTGIDRESSSAPASPRPARSHVPSPQQTPPTRRHRYSSASPIRQLLNSPLLNRRRNKKPSESSDDENSNGGYSEVNGRNYRDLESFQKAQLRNKIKRAGGLTNVISSNNSSEHRNPTDKHTQRRQLVMHNKAPMWNENSQVYQLDFGGRVTQESAKNFQIEYHGKQVMQFGRIDGNAYTLDFQYPFSALQAFSVALANVTQRLK